MTPVAGEHHDAKPKCLQRRDDAAALGRSVSAMANAATSAAVDRREHRRLAVARPRSTTARKTAVSTPLGAATPPCRSTTRRAIDARAHAAAGDRVEVESTVGVPARCAAAANATIAAASGCSDRRSTAAIQPSVAARSTPVGERRHRSTRGRPSVSVPVLSSTTVSTDARRSSGSPPLIRTPGRGAAAAGHHHRGRHRQAHRARARDDQHRHRRGERTNERRLCRQRSSQAANVSDRNRR